MFAAALLGKTLGLLILVLAIFMMISMVMMIMTIKMIRMKMNDDDVKFD